jgi:hypothetical protein
MLIVNRFKSLSQDILLTSTASYDLDLFDVFEVSEHDAAAVC